MHCDSYASFLKETRICWDGRNATMFHVFIHIKITWVSHEQFAGIDERTGYRRLWPLKWKQYQIPDKENVRLFTNVIVIHHKKKHSPAMFKMCQHAVDIM